MQRFLTFIFFLAAVVSLSYRPAVAQTSKAPRITRRVNEAQRETLTGNTHRLARSEFDRGAAPVDLPMERMLLVLNRSADQETQLESLLAQQQDPSSAQYHRWLTPQEFGQQFGAADQDIQTVKAWLESHGFVIDRIANGRNVIEFSGTAGQVREAFRTEIHQFAWNGEEHWANASDPQIPAALAPVVAGVATLHNFNKKAQLIRSGQTFEASYGPGLRPQFNASSGAHALSPADYAVIYNINPLYQAGINGAGTTIAVVARTNINLQDIVSFRSTFGLSANPPQVIVNGTDPGDPGGSEEAEAVLDTSWAGATAPGATVKLVVSKSTNVSDGVDLSELYIVDNNVGDVMTESFGDCEANYTAAEATYYSSLAQQASAEGITYTVAAGDSGAAGCDDPAQAAATHALSVNILASTPYSIAVGGTQFMENGNSVYWNVSNSSTDESAAGYIPENVWNESCTSSSGVNPCTTGNTPGLWAGGGGASLLFPKPSWQSGVPGIPADGARDIPDVSLTAAGHDAYLVCIDASCTLNSRGRISFSGYSGTSAATPSFAGIMALVVQRTGERQGQADYRLYGLAAQENPSQCNASNPAVPAPQVLSNCVFNDVTLGNNAVPGEAGYGTTSGLYQAGLGYDLATGLGSINVANLVNGWIQEATGGTFGEQKVTGMSSPQQISITNSTSGVLSISSIVLSGANPEDFAEVSNCGATLSPGASCTVHVVFNPQLMGTRSAVLVVNTSDPDSPRIFALTGTGVLRGLFEIVNSRTGKVLDIANGSSADGAAIQQNALNGTLQQQWQITSIAADRYAITNALTGKVLDVTGASISNGAVIQQWDYLGDGNQQWQLTPVDDVHYKIVNVSSGKALDVTGGSALNGAPIQQWDYVGDAQQMWVLVPVGTYNVINALSGDGLDLAGGSSGNGTLIQQSTLNGNRQQQWQLMPVGGGYYAILNKLTGKVLDVTGASTAAGATIQEWDYLGGSNQQWQLVPLYDSSAVFFYKLVNRLSGKVLDDTGESTSSGTVVQQYDYLGGTNQQWQLAPVTYYNIVNRLSGAVLDIPGGLASNGTVIQQWASNGLTQQQWQLVPVGAGYNLIVNNLTGKVLDVTGSSTANGAQIEESDETGGSNQQWQFVPVGASYYEIVNKLSGKVFDVTGASTSNGALIQQWQYLGASNQQWQLVLVSQ